MQTRRTIVIPSGADPLFIGTPQLEKLKQLCRVVAYEDAPKTVQELVRRTADAEIAITTSGTPLWSEQVFRGLPKLKLLIAASVGVDEIDLSAAKAHGVIVCNVPGKTSPTVAEHAFGLMFAAAKRAPAQTAALKRGVWSPQQNMLLQGKTLGIVGLGNTGTQIARLAKGIGMNVLAWTFTPSDQRARESGVRFVAFDDLLRQSDVVSLHVALTDRTRYLIGQRELGLMKRGALLVNCSRGAVVDTDALVDALNSGHLSGAALDVFEQEPLPRNSPLLSCENVVLTPHVADSTPEARAALREGVVENAAAFLAGEPQNIVT